MRIAFVALLPVLFGGFWFLYHRNKMSIVPSYFLTLFLLTATVLGLELVFTQLIASNRLIASVLLVLFLLPFLFLLWFGLYGLVSVLLINTHIMFKKERRSLPHALTFLLALCFIGFSLVTRFAEAIDLPDFIEIFLYAGYFLAAFYFVHIVHYAIASTLCNLARPKHHQQYVIVHGSGLVNGKVPPLLASRVDRAIAFYRKQSLASSPPKLILSGGQGDDELMPEAQAMLDYTLAHGIPRDDILLEAKSKTTLENMLFSKEIMDAQPDTETSPYRCIFSTSNYHLLRTGMYAKIAGLRIDGIGAKTALYYLPNALIREYVAYVVMQKKRHIAWVLFVFFCACILSAVLFLNR